MWYNSIKPLLKNVLNTRPAKFLTKLAKDIFTSLWQNQVKPLWNALFQWIVSRDPVSSQVSQSVTNTFVLHIIEVTTSKIIL